MKLLIRLLFLCASCVGCATATGTIGPDGTMSFTVSRFYLDKHKYVVEYEPDTKSLHITVDTEAQHLPWKEIGSFVGAAIATGVKTGVGVP